MRFIYNRVFAPVSIIIKWWFIQDNPLNDCPNIINSVYSIAMLGLCWGSSQSKKKKKGYVEVISSNN